MKGILYLFWLLRSYPGFYKIYYQMYRRHRGDRVSLPKKKDDLYFDGYPRSGNTYIINLITHLLGDNILKCSSHLHSVAGLKIALKLDIKTIIIIRHPIDSISSYYYAESLAQDSIDIKLLKILTKQYNYYYNYILQRSNQIKIINFENAISNEFEFINGIAAWMNLDPISNDIFERKLEDYKNLMNSVEKSKGQFSSSLPRENRTNFKMRVKPYLQKIPDYKISEELFDRIKQITEHE